MLRLPLSWTVFCLICVVYCGRCFIHFSFALHARQENLFTSHSNWIFDHVNDKVPHKLVLPTHVVRLLVLASLNTFSCGSLTMMFLTCTVVLSNWSNLTPLSLSCDETINILYIWVHLRCVYSLDVSSTSHWRDVRFTWYASPQCSVFSYHFTWYGTHMPCQSLFYDTLDTQYCTLVLFTSHLSLSQIKRAENVSLELFCWQLL